MKIPHLFEFMDQQWLPVSLHATLREILECGNCQPFRPYYNWVAHEVEDLIRQAGYENVVELGAGTAPISRLLAQRPSLGGVRLIVCDAHPDPATYADLEKKYPGRVFPEHDPVDFSQRHEWPDRTLLLLSGTFHHIPPQARAEVLQNLTKSADRVMICEPLRRTLPSVGFVFLSLVPALVLPLWFLPRPGKLRRFVWCWLLPVAPPIFWWEGFVSCLRMWTDDKWRANLENLSPPERKPTVKHSTFSQMVVW